MNKKHSTIKSFLDDILFVIVSYKLNISVSASFQTISSNIINHKNKFQLLVYDNSPMPQMVFENHPVWDIKYFHNPMNAGISAAYNFAAEYAKEINKSLLFFIDQDTNFPLNSIEEYFTSYNLYTEYNLFVPCLKVNDSIISPCKYIKYKGIAIKHIQPGLHTFKKYFVLNSGMLITHESFIKNNGYNSKIRLDFSDIEFISRYKKENPIFCLVNTTAIHGFANSTEVFKMDRFISYCKDAKQLRIITKDYFSIFILTFMRSIKLSLKNKNKNIFKVWLNYFVK